MHSIAGTVHVAAPDALKAEQNITMKLRSHLLQLIGKADRCPSPQTNDRAKRPPGVRPTFACDKSHFVPGFCYATPKSL
jgi:hypothetical protein